MATRQLFDFDSAASSVIDGAKARRIEAREAKQRKFAKLEDELYNEFVLWGLPLPVRQFRFHPGRQWRVDFCWPERKIIVEVQGGIFIPGGAGGHNRGAYMEQEYEKHNAAIAAGYRVFKFGPKACYQKKRTQTASQALAFLRQILL